VNIGDPMISDCRDLIMPTVSTIGKYLSFQRFIEKTHIRRQLVSALICVACLKKIVIHLIGHCHVAGFSGSNHLLAFGL